MLQGVRDGQPVLVESTVNQVNQFGGYTGMTPADFKVLVEAAALSSGLPEERIILGADHLGPYPWRAEAAADAMAKSAALAAASVRAGYEKIHLDASMPLGGDPLTPGGGLDPRTAAEREAELAAAAEAAFAERRAADSRASPPVYVIGTEVPPPGGILSSDQAVPVTRVEDFLETVELCREAFQARGIGEAWSRVSAVVAQPGVEYGDQEVHEYDPRKAARLCAAARGSPGVVIEGHSTDYQRPSALRQMVEDGVAILKVGPALTFALRECLFSLEQIERELGARVSSGLAQALEKAMVDDPTHWKAYYSGTAEQMRLARRFSLSDRCRYYWSVPGVHEAVSRLLSNLAAADVPPALLSQFLPIHYRRIREGALSRDPQTILRESVRLVLEDYSAAARGAEGTRAST
jgi:D-tagatose-1,6-bisphosphate aldolase subunit GatZ/KbaZ